MWSGVYYIDVPQKSGGITFENYDVQRFQLNVIDYNQNNSESWTIVPETDTIIFFPSEVYHKIETNESNMTRYSIAFKDESDLSLPPLIILIDFGYFFFLKYAFKKLLDIVLSRYCLRFLSSSARFTGLKESGSLILGCGNSKEGVSIIYK